MPLRQILLLFCSISLQVFGNCSSENTNYDVIVVGAGVSGLASANLLTKHGLNVLVLEATDRIGGRIRTVNPWGSNLDLGASWIQGIENNPIFDIVSDMNASVQPSSYNEKCLECRTKSMVIYDTDGIKISKERMKVLSDYSAEFLKSLAQSATKNRDRNFLDLLNEFAKKNKITGKTYDEFYHLIILLLAYEWGTDLQNISVKQFELVDESGAMGTSAILPLGYTIVTSKLAKNLKIQLNSVVEKITYGQAGVELKTNKGSFTAEYGIVTVPLGVLKAKSISFEPILPEDKQEAIDKMEMSLLNKIYLFFPCSFWDEDVEWISYVPAKGNRQRVFDIMNLKKFTHQPILLCFTAASFGKELENISDKETVDIVMKDLKKMYGSQIPSPSSAIITRWGKDPYTKGSYSFLPPSAKGDEYEAMAEPVEGRLYFGGEASSQHEPSSVYGAFMRGEQIANEIIQILEGK